MPPRAALSISLLLLLGCADPRPPARRASTAGTVRVVPPPSPPADSEEVTDQLRVYGRVVQLRRLTADVFGRHRVLVDGHEVLSGNMEGLAIHAVLQARQGPLVVLDVTPGGVGCQEMFRVLELRHQGPPRITPEFGTCSEEADVRLAGGRLQVWTASWLPVYIGLLDPDAEGTPAQMHEYRDGEMVLIARGRRADRLHARW